MRNHEQIIVKRQQRRNTGPKSGGAWKVAFADFTLAMMAFFMVLWILAVSNQEEREVVASRLRDYSIMDSEANPFDIRNSPYPVDLGGNPSVLDEVMPKYQTEGQPMPRHISGNRSIFSDEGKNGYESLLVGKIEGEAQMKQLAGFIGSLADEVQAKNNLELQLVPQGLRILIRDDEQREMYSRGSARITPFFRHMLLALAPVFQRIENKIMISGHTDSTPFAGDNYSNWELSSDRAMMARRVLQAGGMPPDRVGQVSAMSDTMLEDRANPHSSQNRRIELLIMTTQAENSLKQLFSSQTQAAAQQAKDALNHGNSRN
ncbi:lateral flagellar motor protein LafU [Aeromonas enteropelogenes]|uniref:LafU n=2 Tax=Aeromonas TaxID=642 RepID=A0A175VGD0_AEREN|nr:MULTISPECIES: lateral flagellar motor protein LafU [Aeromonas]KXU79764.1 LafU [Aeromonas enteropelogenes]MBL0458069.1 lateral flagellar motor protein LafU [Aeromonas enteropelogenes]MBL0521854.1 lateral flagellar motor protein LafU [Aeromonas enteropelogenes]MCZ0752126.1 lateral flagellar motor protein LafU [Aeromonas enteropelogenes]QXC35297.1 lateral flagellar motor protein LafU [Aeromonas sp. FDAARGOS 1407]